MRERSPLAPGDPVIDLGALCRSAAIAAGAISGGVCWWPITPRWFLLIAAVFLGVICGATVGGVLAGLVFRNRATGYVVIVKKESAASGVAIFAGLLGAVPTVAMMASVPLMRGFPAGGIPTMMIGIGAALLAAICFSMASARY